MPVAYESIKLAPYLEVMVADSDGMFCALVDEYLRLHRFENIFLVTSEELVLWKLARRSFDIILLERCQEYKSIWEIIKGKYNTSLIVGVTFDRSGRSWLQAVRSGADAVLTKPFTHSRLAQALSDLLISPASRRCKIVQLPPALDMIR